VLGRLGPRPGTIVNLDGTFVLYGTGTDDPRLGLGYLLLRAMDVQVKVFAGGFQSWAEGGDRPVVRIISTADLKRSLKARERKEASDPVIFDLREEWDFREGHLPGAESLPSHEFAEQIEKRIARERPPVDRLRTPFIFYCYGRECIRSRECAAIAARHGFLSLYWYREDVDHWRHEGGTVVSLEESDKSKTTAQIYNSLESVRPRPAAKRKVH
jgi:thiosulfate/3-mercaptopyruvate sulfurtransferase